MSQICLRNNIVFFEFTSTCSISLRHLHGFQARLGVESDKNIAVAGFGSDSYPHLSILLMDALWAYGMPYSLDSTDMIVDQLLSLATVNIF